MRNGLILFTVAMLIIVGTVFFLQQSRTDHMPSIGGSGMTSKPALTDGGDQNTNPTAIRSENIVVTSPQSGSMVSSPIVVRGEARTFENTVNVRLSRQDGTVLTEEYTTAQSPDIGQFGPFQIELSYALPSQTAGIIEVFQYSARDGSETDKVTIPVTLQTNDNLSVRIYFNNTTQGTECEQVVPSTRQIPRTQQTARAALEELLKGPTQTEKAAGMVSSINRGVNIQRLTIENGVAYVDFDQTLEAQVGGSCRVAAIRAQITETLKQFDTVDQVIISIDGRTDDILQP